MTAPAPGPALPASAPSRRRGPLRAGDGRLAVGLRVLLHVLVLLGSVVAGSGLALLARRAGAPAPVRGAILAAAYAGGTLAGVRLVRRRVDRRPLDGLGLRWRTGGDVAAGAATGLAMLLAVLGAERALGWATITGVGWDAAMTSAAVQGLLVFCAVGFCEELVFRGAVLADLTERWSTSVAVVASGILFGLLHLATAPLGPRLIVSAISVTALLTLARLVTGSVWWAVGWHAAWDFGQEHLLGLAAAQGTGTERALVRITAHGPPAWIGDPSFLESGGLVILAQTAGAVVLAAILARRRRRGGAGDPAAGLADG